VQLIRGGEYAGERLHRKSSGLSMSAVAVLQGKLQKMEDEQDKDLDHLGNLVGQLKNMGTVRRHPVSAENIETIHCSHQFPSPLFFDWRPGGM